MPFVNDPVNKQTYDLERDVSLVAKAGGRENYREFLLKWQGRNIPFGATWNAIKPDPNQKSIVSWEVICLGTPLSRSELASYTFQDEVEKEAVRQLIVEALSTYFPFSNSPSFHV